MTGPRAHPLTERHPDEIVAITPEGEVGIGRFLAEASALAAALPDCRYVINLQSDRYGYLRGFVAAVMAGKCTLMPPNRQAGTVSRLREAYPDSCVIDEFLETPAVSGSTLKESAIYEVPADQLCAIAFTSGSTGDPKPNLKSWRTLVAGSACNRRLLIGSLPQTINMVATVPPQHMWGFETSILLPLFASVAISHRTPFFPAEFADALMALSAPRALVSTPVHLDALQRSGVALPQLVRIYSATAPLSRELALALEQRCGAEVLDIFGCSETGILARRRTATETRWTLADAFELYVEADGARVAAEHLPESVLLPDIVELCGARQFRWIGRQQDMINIAGKRGSLADLNLRLKAIPGVEDGVIFLPESGRGRLAALVVAPGLEADDILRQLRHHVEPAFLPRPLYRVSRLPRQATGKLRSTDVQAEFERLHGGRTPPVDPSSST